MVVDESPTKEAHSPPWTLASGKDAIYISDDAALDMSDASGDEATDETTKEQPAAIANAIISPSYASSSGPAGSMELECTLDRLNLFYDSLNRALIYCDKKCQHAISVERGRPTDQRSRANVSDY